jgi:hypothetical protein
MSWLEQQTQRLNTARPSYNYDITEVSPGSYQIRSKLGRHYRGTRESVTDWVDGVLRFEAARRANREDDPDASPTSTSTPTPDADGRGKLLVVGLGVAVLALVFGGGR